MWGTRAGSMTKLFEEHKSREREKMKREGATYWFDKLSALHDEEYKADDVAYT